MDLNSILNSIDGFVWGMPLIVLLVGVGIYLTVGVGFAQITHMGHWMKNTIGKSLEKTESKDGSVSPFQALCTALAATVGTGNISGVAGAIAIGGPGAVFWMWVSAFFGQVTKYAEVVLAVKYREKNEKGDWVGGPMYYIKNGLGSKWTWMANIFALFAAFAAFGIGNCTQVDSVVTAVKSVATAFSPTGAISDTAVLVIKIVCGLAIALLAGFALVGGIKRIGEMLEKVVPFMAIMYLVAGAVAILFNIKTIPAVFAMIIKGAFKPAAIAGGLMGATIKTAMVKGIGRGLFSNEAGLGSAPIAHAGTSETDPVKQGFYGMFEVFADTICICTFSALIVLCGCKDINYGQAADFRIVIEGMNSVFDPRISTLILGLALTLFAATTIISWGLYGSKSIEFVFGHKAVKPYQVIFCLFVIFGTFMGLDAAWTLASILNGLMAVPNLVAIIPLSPVIFKLTKEYFANQK